MHSDPVYMPKKNTAEIHNAARYLTGTKTIAKMRLIPLPLEPVKHESKMCLYKGSCMFTVRRYDLAHCYLYFVGMAPLYESTFRHWIPRTGALRKSD